MRRFTPICADVGALLAGTYARQLPHKQSTSWASVWTIRQYFDLQTFHPCVCEQMKPPAHVLASDSGRMQWETRKTSCCTSSAPCDKWNKHLGAETAFEDLPLSPPDYDWSLNVCCCGTLYEYKAKNPDPEAGTSQPFQPAAGQQPPPQPQIQNQASGAGPSSLQQMPPGWKAVKDPATGKTYYQNDFTKQTQWEKPSTQR